MTYKKKLELLFVGAGLLLILMLFIVPNVDALDLKFARQCRAIDGDDIASGDTLRIQAIGTDSSPHEMPDAYLIWAGDGEAVLVSRLYATGPMDVATGTTPADPEAVQMKVPEGASLLVPAPPPYKIANLWSHVFRLEGTVSADSVYVLPMDQ